MNSEFKIKTGVRLPELDGLRGVAILMVVLHHYVAGQVKWDGVPAGAVFNAFSRLSWSGVDLFFVLSGFLIGGILLDQRRAENYFKTFYVRRACRIFPLYFLWLLLFIGVNHFLPRASGPDWWTEIFAPRYPNWAYYVFAQNFFVAQREIFGPLWLVPVWSLAVEEQFYLVAPWLVRFLPARKLPLVVLAIIAVVPLFRVFLYMFHPIVFAYVLLPCRADTLLLGVLCAGAVRNERARVWLEANRRWLYLALAVLLAGTWYLSSPRVCSRTSFEMVFFGYSWLGLLFACILLIVVTAKTSLIAGLMRVSWLRQLGIIAYGVFLMHLAVAGLAHGLILGRNLFIGNLIDGIVTFVAFLITLALATLSWRWVEKPIVDWGHSFVYTTHDRRPVK